MMTHDYVVVRDTTREMPNAGFAELMAAVLAKGDPFRFTASGFSMSPFILDGDVLTLAPVLRRLRFGEVVAFINPYNNRLSVHRVICMGHNAYLIRGDNTPKPDGTILHADILGRVIRVERGGQNVRLGLGFERIAIAFLSHRDWLMPLIVSFQYIYHFIFKRVQP